MGQVRDIWLFLGVLWLKSQIPSTPPKRRRAGKFQINHKYQAPRQKDGGQASHKQAPNYKQITNKLQITSTPPKRWRTGKFQTRAKTIFLFFCLLFGISPFGHWNLFVICNLLFGI
ncbi:MAG: hypothetical protein JRJ46_08935 [Deltaproteobacteria bacterium]|nr:hypothetical protein [Deltaproteobacteria bacterium]